jgi:hypothetical protein
MLPTKRRGVAVETQEVPQSQEAPAPKRHVGRPPGEASTIVNVRLPLPLVARLDHYLDRLEWQTGLKANRGMIARRALELFLVAHEHEVSPSVRAGRQPGHDEPSVPVRRRRTGARSKAR